MSRILSKKNKTWGLDDLAVASVAYVLTPGVVLGSLAASAKAGVSVATILLSLLYGACAFFAASLHLGAAERAGAQFVIPVIGGISAVIGVALFVYGVSIYLGVLS